MLYRAHLKTEYSIVKREGITTTWPQSVILSSALPITVLPFTVLPFSVLYCMYCLNGVMYRRDECWYMSEYVRGKKLQCKVRKNIGSKTDFPVTHFVFYKEKLKRKRVLRDFFVAITKLCNTNLHFAKNLARVVLRWRNFKGVFARG